MVAAGRALSMRQLPLAVRLRERATFDSFVAGDNAELLSRLQAMAAGAGGVCWIWGSAGSGRSHLLQAVCAAVQAPRRAAYLPLAQFGPIDPSWLEGWGAVECLCIDDLPLALGDAGRERALFNLFREREERGVPLLVSADAPPAAQRWLLPDIASRFGGSAVFELHSLDEVGQGEALRRRAALRGVELPEETLRWVQRRWPRDMRALCELLDTLDDAALAAQRRLTVPFIREVVGDRE
jgi:DnaA family protein